MAKGMENLTEEEYDDCMAKGMENMQEETGSVEERSVETMTAKVMTTSTVYTFADGTSVTETVDANGVKVLTTDSGQSITLGANVSQENMDTEVKPDTLLGDTVTSAPVPMPPTNPSPSSPPTNRPSSMPSKNPTPSQESSAGNPASTSTYSTLGSFTDLTASYDQMQEETGSVEESSVGTMTSCGKEGSTRETKYRREEEKRENAVNSQRKFDARPAARRISKIRCADPA